MNSCERYQELISRLVDGEVSHDEYEALMAHMESCSRCNAMYAVFHDLSDLLAEEAEEPLPEGLHENIMAGVRRSAMVKKNRRMRSIGLRTALTAAACAVLVLFASRVLAPQERAESVSIRSQQAAEELLPASTAEPAKPTPAPEQTAAVEAAPAPEAEVPAPAADQVIAPEPSPAETMSAQDSFLTAGSAEQEAAVPVLPEAPPVAAQQPVAPPPMTTTSHSRSIASLASWTTSTALRASGSPPAWVTVSATALRMASLVTVAPATASTASDWYCTI